MSSDDQEHTSRAKLIDENEEDTEAPEEVVEDEPSVEELLKDLETEHDVSDLDDDEESVEDLLKALVDDEEAKLEKAFNKRRKSTGNKSNTGSKHSKSDEAVELETLRGAESQALLSESNINLKLDLSRTYNLQTSKNQPVTPTALHKNKRARKLYQKHASQKGKIACGIFCISMILAIGFGVSFIAYKFNIRDLYIIGGIFTIGGIVFLIGFVIVRCTIQNDPGVYLTLHQSASPTQSV